MHALLLLLLRSRGFTAEFGIPQGGRNGVDGFLIPCLQLAAGGPGKIRCSENEPAQDMRPCRNRNSATKASCKSNWRVRTLGTWQCYASSQLDQATILHTVSRSLHTTSIHKPRPTRYENKHWKAFVSLLLLAERESMNLTRNVPFGYGHLWNPITPCAL
jgi:hypothetical protein